MKVGTKSVLFGAHAFWLHPWFVAEAWSRLYGFPWQPWLWVLFFVHDIGYLGKPNMDGEEGEMHPWTGARILYRLQRLWMWRPWSKRHTILSLDVPRGNEIWGNVALYHSRFLAKKYETTPSRLCIADKLALTLTPWWLYLPMAIATGEIREYMKLATERTAAGEPRYAHVHAGQNISEGLAVRIFGDRGVWWLQVQTYMRKWVEEHKDGREDTWTPDMRKAKTESGVWS